MAAPRLWALPTSIGLGRWVPTGLSSAKPALKLRLLSYCLLTLGLALWLLGCGSVAQPPSSPHPAAGAQQPGPSALGDREWAVLRSSALGLKLALPEGKTWTSPSKRAPRGAGWQLLHPASGSRLELLRWRASRLPRVDACDAELRARHANLITPDETTIVAQRMVAVPAGFSTRITLLALPGTGTRVRGQAIAIAAGIGECVAAIADTECAGDAELAERLRLFDVALSHLRLLRVEDRVPPRKLPER